MIVNSNPPFYQFPFGGLLSIRSLLLALNAVVVLSLVWAIGTKLKINQLVVTLIILALMAVGILYIPIYCESFYGLTGERRGTADVHAYTRTCYSLWQYLQK